MINCTFEDGGKAKLRHVVVDALVVKENKVLLIKRAPHLINGNKWAVPGGYVDRDETLVQAVTRELKEETGLDARKVKLFKVIDDPNRPGEDRQNVAFVYKVEAAGDIKFDPKEVTKAKWFDFDKLPDQADFAFDHFEIIGEFLRTR